MSIFVVGSAKIYPEWKIFEYFVVNEHQSALSVDATLSAQPMTKYVQSPDSIQGRFNYVSYAKC